MATKKEITISKHLGKVLQEPCFHCKGSTNHEIIASIDEDGEDKFGHDYSVYWNVGYQIIQCKGCNSISFRKESSNSEDYIQVSEDDYETDISVDLYPSRNENRACIDDAYLLPNNVERIYAETVKAMNNDQAVLAGIGIRALLEAICKDKQANGQNLFQKIDDLVQLGILNKDGAVILHKVRSLGNDAAHEVKPHSSDQLSLALDLVEHLLSGVYLYPYYAKKIFK